MLDVSTLLYVLLGGILCVYLNLALFFFFFSDSFWLSHFYLILTLATIVVFTATPILGFVAAVRQNASVVLVYVVRLYHFAQ